VKIGVIFTASKNKERAKEFVKFLLQEENLGPYVEGGLGRWFPVTSAGQKSPFWQSDRHRKAVYAQFTGGTLPFDFTKNYKFTILNNENVWAKAMNRVVSEKVPVDKAVDELIARIKQVAGERGSQRRTAGGGGGGGGGPSLGERDSRRVPSPDALRAPTSPRKRGEVTELTSALM